MSVWPPHGEVPIPGYTRRLLGRVLIPLVSAGTFSWAPFAWTAVRQRSSTDAAIAAASFVTVICTMTYSYRGGNGLVVWALLLILMFGGSVLAGLRTPRTENERTWGKPAAVWLVSALAAVYFIATLAFAPGGSGDQEETTPPSVTPATSLSSEPDSTAEVTESAAPPDVPDTLETEEPRAPEASDKPKAPKPEDETEPGDNEGTGGQDSDGQVGVGFGRYCAPVGALGITGDGRPAKCFMGRDGRARWGYDSNRG